MSARGPGHLADGPGRLLQPAEPRLLQWLLLRMLLLPLLQWLLLLLLRQWLRR